ncbi:MAG: Uncharacterized protein XD82_0998 [Methanoculleus marisnigri]|uniref:ATPase BadF/BadG/BcrA/BcrD type domain-containing protein n=1 Tax=Methanoculleus marisnigri TaxID=2198 RepID=A0A101GNI9_9EURY|nr:MAG: Uncharacterized protein XD82_0998 [Methanoculleus marisnigri]
MGVDSGSSTTKAVVMKDNQIVGTGWHPTTEVIKSAESAVRDALAMAGLTREDIQAIGTTGYGRFLIGKHLGADLIQEELTVNSKGAVYLAGHQSGRFLEMTAKRLGVDITELGPLAMKGMGKNVSMNSYCIVFGTQSLVNALAAGSSREDVAAAACHSVAEQVFEQQLQEIDIKEPVIMVGGTSLIEGLVYAMGQLLQTEIVVPPYSQYIGAVGSALLASGFVQGE